MGYGLLMGALALNFSLVLHTVLTLIIDRTDVQSVTNVPGTVGSRLT